MEIMHKYQQELSSAVIGITIAFCFIFFYETRPNGYEIKLKNEHIAYVENKEDFDNVVEKIEKKINTRFKDFIIKDKFVIEKVLIDDSAFDSEDVISKSIYNNSLLTVSGLEMFSDNNFLGVVSDKNEGINILTRLRDYYAKNNEFLYIDESCVINNINFKNVDIPIAQIVDTDKIYKNIIKLNTKGSIPLVSFRTVGRVYENKDIFPGTVVKLSDELEEGQFKVMHNGKNGVKQVNKQIIIENNKIISRKILEEKVIKPAEPKVVMRGKKINIANDTISCLKPSRGTITSGFGMRWGRMHKGIDIAAPLGSPIESAEDGIVTYAGWMDGYGKVIMLKHKNNIETVYGHCSSILVKKGQSVKKGQLIGKVGSTGRSTGPHVHFEVRIDGVPQNPMDYIRESV